ncbi:MAG TPA: efflux RND transporter periplasmic adaptor subunit [Accumulibacter sp.]|uniref:efflux RND transporter periplasmic adaptor subunit n=1 Tax=Accumulibacter sp. TaxID=2053492 RepID=UPI002879B428|nr:efflux RND transporter periplasmic adaptor subunit [Accumulibacter sp.]MDS4056739.1 efflux RND transporter periplasmic adaptor subunit [Accumulibacter sp.]HMW80916.1 efflux RND transporter periplasmic adaptor subunit [Accumulibacter sp.]HMX70082.1 efflux RND transporter periplasmic adaptor subunit [Accumulibacter sp.]HNB68473.1 efflux RND transporter periplasmic adaptor subunit [Accumulibacter sp.]HNC27804.1 efflux RND transporter periplasmic adaptor subunit [Accumulibacter sp.]
MNLRSGHPTDRWTLLALTLFAALPVHAAPALGCLIEPYQVAEVGSQVIGVLDKVLVDRGSAIQKGQVLATLKADVEKAAAGIARSRAQAQADLQAAQASRDYNRQRLARANDLVARNFISPQAREQTQNETEVAEQRLAQAREQKRIWDYEYEMARAQLSLRKLLSPLSGVVIERYLSPGERVEDRPVLKVATMDPLRVEVFMPAASYRQVKPGMSATVYPDLPDAGQHSATVTLVDQFIDPASNTFRVRLELPNPNNELPAGLRCKVAIGDQPISNPISSGRDSMQSVPAPAAGTPPGPPAATRPPTFGTPPPSPRAPAPAAPPTGALPRQLAPAVGVDRSAMLPAAPPALDAAARFLQNARAVR